MSTINNILKEIKVSGVSRILGYDLRTTATAVSRARKKGAFPSGWYIALKAECDRLGIECPVELFDFKRPDSSVAEESKDSKK